MLLVSIFENFSYDSTVMKAKNSIETVPINYYCHDKTPTDMVPINRTILLASREWTGISYHSWPALFVGQWYCNMKLHDIVKKITI